MRRAGALLAALACAATVWAAATAAGDGRRIVAVGDVHGAADAFGALLLATGLAGEDDRWAGGDAVLVQTGDFLDRGAGAIAVAHWLMELQREAPEQGGEVIVLLGNHEVINLIGDTRYVTAEIVAPLANERSEKRRAETCKERAAILRKSARALGQKPPPASAVRKACVEAHPAGMIEYIAALRPDQPLGRWLRSLPVAVTVDGVLFVHGGIGPEVAGQSLEEIGHTIYRELEAFESWRRWLIAEGWMVAAATLPEMAQAVRVVLELEERRAAEEGAGEKTSEATAPPAASDRPDLVRLFELSDTYLLSAESPLWFRGYDAWTEEEGRAQMPDVLAAYGVRHVVVGHTPRDPGRIEGRFGDRVFLIDTGMLAEYYGGAPAALEIVGGSVTAIYLDEEVVLYEEPEGH